MQTNQTQIMYNLMNLHILRTVIRNRSCEASDYILNFIIKYALYNYPPPKENKTKIHDQFWTRKTINLISSFITCVHCLNSVLYHPFIFNFIFFVHTYIYYWFCMCEKRMDGLRIQILSSLSHVTPSQNEILCVCEIKTSNTIWFHDYILC